MRCKPNKTNSKSDAIVIRKAFAVNVNLHSIAIKIHKNVNKSGFLQNCLLFL
jgi:hypothetical protein